MRIKALLLGIFLGVVSAAAGKENWIYTKMPEFDVLSCASESETRDIVVQFEQFRVTILKLLGNPNVSKIPIHIVVFSSDSQLDKYKPLVDGKPGSAIAYFSSTSAEAVVCMSAENSEQGEDLDSHTAMWGYTSHIIESTGMRYPRWVVTGLADFYSSFHLERSGRGRVGVPSVNHIRYLNSTFLMPISDLLAVGATSATYQGDSRETAVFFAESWALVHFLMCSEDPNYKGALGRYLNLLNDPNLPRDAAFNKAFGATPKQVESDLRAYLRSGSFNQLVFQVPKSEVASVNPVFRPATELDVVLGQQRALWYMRKTGDTAYKLNQLAEKYPQSPQIFELQATIALSESDDGRCFDLWEKACALGTENLYVLQTTADRILQQRLQGGIDTRVPEPLQSDLRTRLSKVLAIDPQSERAWNSLALLEAVSVKPSKENVMKIQENFKNLRNRTSTAFYLAVLQFRSGAYDSSKQTLEALVEFEKTPENIRNNSNQLLRRIRAKQRAALLEEPEPPEKKE